MVSVAESYRNSCTFGNRKSEFAHFLSGSGRASGVDLNY